MYKRVIDNITDRKKKKMLYSIRKITEKRERVIEIKGGNKKKKKIA